MLKSAVGRIQNLVEDLLRNSKVSNSKKPLLNSSEQLLATVESLLVEKKLEYLKQIPSIEIEWTDSNIAESKIYFEPYKLSRMLSNILNNSLEATDNLLGKITIKILEDSQYVWIQVQDTGKGIPAEIVSQIGKKQLTYGKIQGQGLGLFTAFEEVRKWYGEIQIHSSLGEGTLLQIGLKKDKRNA